MNRLLRREKEQDLDAKRKARLSQKIHDARVNLNYTIYYPLTEKYISLYPKSKDRPEEAGAESASEPDTKKEEKVQDGAKPPLWPVVEKCMEEGSLDLLREGKLNIGADGQKIPESSKKAASVEAHKSETKKEREEQKEPKDIAKKKKHASRHAESSSKRDKHDRKYHEQKRSKLYDVSAAPDDSDSDGGFFEE